MIYMEIYLHYQLPIKVFKNHIIQKGSIEGHQSTLALYKDMVIVQYVVQITMNEAKIQDRLVPMSSTFFCWAGTICSLGYSIR